jgi:hypothetical protein
MQRIKVYNVDLVPNDVLLVGAFLDLVALTNGCVFGFCQDLSEAHIVIFDPSSPRSAHWFGKPTNHRQARIAYTDLDIAGEQGLWLLRRQIRLDSLRPILIQIVEGMQLSPKTSTAASMVADSLWPTKFSANAIAPAKSGNLGMTQMVDIVTRVFKDRVPHAIVGISGMRILLIPESTCVSIERSRGEAERGEHQTDASWQTALRSNRRPLSVFPRIGAKADTETLRLDKFLWEIAKLLSGGTLLPGIAHLKMFGLTRWPDFGALGGTQNELRSAALLMRQPSSIAQISKLINVPMGELVGFLNGCALLGCMRDAPESLTTALPDASRPSTAARAIALDAMPHANPRPALTPVLRAGARSGFVGLLGKLRAALSYGLRTGL